MGAMTALTPPSGGTRLSRDLSLAVLVAGLQVIGSSVSLDPDNQTAPAPGEAGMLVLLTGALALTFRRAAPLLVLAVNIAASQAYQLLDHQPLPLPLAVLVALYTVAVGRPLLGGCAGAAYGVAFAVGSLNAAVPLDDDHLFTYLVSTVATVAVGYGVALGRARATLAEQRTAELAREHDARTRAAVEQEQARIAREVHDIVANDVSVIVAQAAAARRVFDQQPSNAAAALASIEAVGRDALDGLRRLMGLLRSTSLPTDRSPQPSLARLPWLVSQVQRAGLPVDLTIRGNPRPLPATLELNAYRIVQEALTNSLKHANPTRATVVLDYGDEFLHVDVRDQGQDAGHSAVPATSGGYGLISMQQRVAMHGGDLAAGSHDGQGFEVSARFPLTNEVP
jgi:signal transduction histidine kinase